MSDLKPWDRKSLLEFLRKANEAYQVGNPTISDSEYDSLCEYLYEKTGIVFKSFDKGGDYKFSVPMLSIANCFSSKEIESFHKACFEVARDLSALTYVVEPKLDGIALEVQYWNGELVRATTRGDGQFGKDVTEIALKLESFPKTIPNYISGIFRGEAICTKKDFESFNSSSPTRYKTQRNFVAGTFNATEKDVSKRPIKFVAYRTIKGPEYCILNSLGIFGEESKNFNDASFPSTSLSYKDLSEKVVRLKESFFCDVDGLVVKVLGKEAREELGETSTDINWAIAVKVRVEGVETTLKNVNYQVGRTGAVTPVANFHPVEIDGVTISRATLHNFDRVKELGLTLGCTLTIRRAGDVIPEVVSSRPSNGVDFIEVGLPKYCPSCAEPLDYDKCTNEYNPSIVDSGCYEKLLSKLTYFVSKSGLDFDGIGPEVVEALFEERVINCPLDVLLCNDRSVREHLTPKTAEKFIAERDKARTKPLWKFIAALGIEKVGETLSKTLAPHFMDVVNGKMSPSEVLTPAAAESLREYLSFPGHLDFVKANLEVMIPEVVVAASDKLSGLKVAVTGTLPVSREKVEEFLASNGATVSSSVSSKTSWLIYGEKAGSKLAKAKAAGVKTATLEEFTGFYGLSL